jgi:hypothetical protein
VIIPEIRHGDVPIGQVSVHAFYFEQAPISSLISKVIGQSIFYARRPLAVNFRQGRFTSFEKPPT